MRLQLKTPVKEHSRRLILKNSKIFKNLAGIIYYVKK